MCKVIVTRVLSLDPYRDERSNCRLKVTHDDLCTRHWNEEQARIRWHERQEADAIEHEKQRIASAAARLRRGARAEKPGDSYYFEGPKCVCGHERGDHQWHVCNHMFATHSECEYDVCDHCECRDYSEATETERSGN